VLVADTHNHTIRRIDVKGVVTTLAGAAGQSGSTDGLGPAARFFFPLGIAVGPGGHMLIADTNNCTVRKLAVGGGVTTLAGVAEERGSVDGVGPEARFYSPWGHGRQVRDRVRGRLV